MVTKNWLGAAVVVGVGFASLSASNSAASPETPLASLVGDLHTGLDESGASPRSTFVLGDKAIFRARVNGFSDGDLWVSDGTAEGTSLLLAHSLGANGQLSFLGSTDDLLFFRRRAFDDPAGSERLWRTDGTPEGTFSVTNSEATGIVTTLTRLPYPVINGRLFFLALGDPAPGDTRLWVSDGTISGTFAIPITLAGGTPHEVLELGTVERRLFFFSRSEGSPGQTSLFELELPSMRPRLVRTFAQYHPAFPVGVNSRLVFLADDARGPELWVSDGTASGTFALTSFDGQHPFQAELWIRVLGDRGYFVASDENGTELWSTNGTRAGTVRVSNLAPESPFTHFDGLGLRSNQIALAGDTVLFLAEGPSGNLFLYSSDGNPISTQRLGLVFVGTSTFSGNFPLLRSTSQAVFFRLSEPDHEALWVSDGTLAGTKPLPVSLCEGFQFLPAVFDSDPTHAYVRGCSFGGEKIFRIEGNGSTATRWVDAPAAISDVLPMALVPGRLLLSAVRAGRGELWAFDGEGESSRPLRMLDREARSSSPSQLTAVGDSLFFRTTLGPNADRFALRTIDGAEIVAVSPDGQDCSDEQRYPLIGANDRAFLTCRTATQVNLWSVDETGSNTNSSTAFSVGEFTTIETGATTTHAYFVLRDSGPSSLLLATSGEPGSVPVLVLQQPSGVVIPLGRDAAGSKLLFLAESSVNRYHLWISDGDAAGAILLTPRDDLSLDVPYAQPPQVAAIGAINFILLQQSSFVDPNQTGFFLWKTDGTALGTAPLRRLPNARYLRALESALLYLSDENSDGRFELGRTDAQGSEPVVLAAGLRLGDMFEPTVLEPERQRLLYNTLAADGRSHLWSHNGEPGGEVLLREFESRFSDHTRPSLASIGGRAFFSGMTRDFGEELWVTDGTPEGTHLVHDIAPGPFSSSPQDLTVAGSRFYFTADDGIHGRELWSLNLDETGCVPSERALCLQDGRFRVEADWRDFQGNEGRGTAVSLTPDTGYFWFFTPSNVEAVLKVLDGRGLNDHFWTFYGALSTVEYNLTVTDAETGVSRRYYNPPGNLASRADTASFGPNGASLERYTPPAEEEGAFAEIFRRDSVDVFAPRGSCAPASNRLCLRNGRFAVEATWRDFQGNSGTGTAIEITGDTGTFWFFRPENLEVILKVLDGTGLNGKHWVFYGALSSVEYTLTVTDTSTGAVKTYINPLGRLASVADTGAF